MFMAGGWEGMKIQLVEVVVCGRGEVHGSIWVLGFIGIHKTDNWQFFTI